MSGSMSWSTILPIKRGKQMRCLAHIAAQVFHYASIKVIPECGAERKEEAATRNLLDRI
jgi:hypothetical protein